MASPREPHQVLGGCLAPLERNLEDKLRSPGTGQGRAGRRGTTPGPKAPGVQARALSRTLPQLGAEGPPVRTALGPLPGRRFFASRRLLSQSQVRSERAPGRAAAVFARVGSLQCRKGQGAPRVPGSDGRTAQRARRRPPSATRPRRPPENFLLSLELQLSTILLLEQPT